MCIRDRYTSNMVETSNDTISNDTISQQLKEQTRKLIKGWYGRIECASGATYDSIELKAFKERQYEKGNYAGVIYEATFKVDNGYLQANLFKPVAYLKEPV